MASALASIGVSIAGLATTNETVAVVGTICTIVSASIYAFCEAWVDATNKESKDGGANGN